VGNRTLGKPTEKAREIRGEIEEKVRKLVGEIG
jgi:hypothetical protein